MIFCRWGAVNSIHIDKPQLRKSAEKNCSEADLYCFGLTCQTGIIRIRFGVADFLPKRVIRLADTVGSSRRRLPCSNKNRAAQNCSHLRARDFRMIFCRWSAVNSIHIDKPQLRKSAEKNCSEADLYCFGLTYIIALMIKNVKSLPGMPEHILRAEPDMVLASAL